MAVVTKEHINNFRSDYEVKNGYIGDEITLNAAPDRLKVELDALWEATLGSNGAVTGSSSNIETQFYDAGEFGTVGTV